MGAGCIVQPNGQVTFGLPAIFAPTVAVAPVAPAPVEVVGPVMIPETYVWDGYEYVGVVGNHYLYLGPGNVWLVIEPFRLERFHGWERDHRDWREHAIRNEHYRTDRYGHVQPMHDVGKVEPRKDDLRKGEVRKVEPRKDDLRKGEVRKDELQKEELKKDELKKDDLRKGDREAH